MKPRPWRLLLAVACVMACALTTAPLRAETIKIVTGADYPPYAEPSLPQGGLATAVVRQAIERAGWELELSWRPWANGYKATLAGEFAGTFPYIKTAERDKLFIYSDPIFELNAYVFGRPGEALDGTQPQTLKGLRYCKPLGWALLPVLAAMEKNKELIILHPNDMSACMKLIVLKKADFTVTDLEQGAHAIKKIAPHPLLPQALGGIMDRQHLHLIMPLANPQSAERMARFNKALRLR
jgi:polar amino acid transport system substrate-binding protein